MWTSLRRSIACCAALTLLSGCTALDFDGWLDLRPRTVGLAEDYAWPLAHGFWIDESEPDTVHGYVDLSVANWAYHKVLAVRLEAHRESGVSEHTLYRLEYRGTERDGRERWGTDLVELWPDSDHHGALTDVDLTFQVQVDTDGDGLAELIPSAYAFELATLDDLLSPATGLGGLATSGTNPDDGSRSIDTSAPLDLDLDELDDAEAFFAPYDDPERAVIEEIEAVTAAQRSDPAGTHTLHGAVFDLNDSRVTDALVEAHEAGVEVKLLTAGYHMAPWRSWETEYPRLQEAGVEVIGVMRDSDLAASMHTKFAVFDGQVVTTGSMNWDTGSFEDNAEDLLRVRSGELAAAYERLFSAIAVEPHGSGSAAEDSLVAVHYSQQDDLARVLYDAIAGATDSVQVAMFTLRTMTTTGDDGSTLDVLDALVDAPARGVEVLLVLESNISDEGEYYGTITRDDGTDEWLASQGIEVVEIDLDDPAAPYAAMHHKFAVIDGRTTLLGSANWSSMTQVSDDDLDHRGAGGAARGHALHLEADGWGPGGDGRPVGDGRGPQRPGCDRAAGAFGRGGAGGELAVATGRRSHSSRQSAGPSSPPLPGSRTSIPLTPQTSKAMASLELSPRPRVPASASTWSAASSRVTLACFSEVSMSTRSRLTTHIGSSKRQAKSAPSRWSSGVSTRPSPSASVGSSARTSRLCSGSSFVSPPSPRPGPP